jgi:D-lactate dehydrogenase
VPFPSSAIDEGRPGVVYFATCLSRMLGPLPGEHEVPTARAMLDVLAAAGFAVAAPRGLDGLCCGMPFASKAFTEAAARCAERVSEPLWEASRQGRYGVVTDASPCAATLKDAVVPLLAASGRHLRVEDFPAFWARAVLPTLVGEHRAPGTAILHPTCTLMKAGGLPDLLKVAHAHSEEVVVPAAAECCGFAGDRGFLVPELTASATVREAAEVRATLASGPSGLYSTCRTCEIGMGRAVGRPYRSLIHLVREAMVGG